MPQPQNLAGSPMADLIPILAIGMFIFAVLAVLTSLPKIREALTKRLRGSQEYLYGPTDEAVVDAALEAAAHNREIEDFDVSIYRESN